MTQSTKSHAITIHEELCELASSQASLDYRLGLKLLEAFRCRVHLVFGFGCFEEYAERKLGWKSRHTKERLRVAKALESLPELSVALSGGAQCWSVVRELTRVATAETERDWIGAGTGKTVRQVEALVRGRVAGERPSDPPPAPEARPQRVLLDLSAQTYALWLDARREMIRELGQSLDDDTFVAALVSKALVGTSPRDAGRSNYQIALTECERCGRGERIAGGETRAIDAATLAAARCDAQVVPRDGKRATQTIPPSIRRQVLLRHDKRCAVPGCRHAAFVDLHHTEARSEGGTHNPEKLVPLCYAHHRHAHEGRLVIRGTYSEGFRFEHADGSRYGTPETSPKLAAAFQTVREMLTSMGYRSSEAQRMVDGARAHVAADATLEQITLAALKLGDLSRVCVVRESVVEYQRLAA